MKNRWKVWAVVALVAIALALGVLRAVSKRKGEQAAVAAAAGAKAEAVVELAASDVVTVAERELAQGLPISGTLRAVNSAVVKARVAGELQGLTVREGDPVKAGQVIARIDPTEFQSRLRQAQQQAESARSQIDIAQRQFDNNKALVDQGFISRTALDTSQANLASAQANYNAAAAAVDVARKSMDDTVVRAPISGTVSARVAQSGERVAVDGRIVEIVDLSRLELEATLAPADSVNVRVGQSATLRIEGSAQGGAGGAAGAGGSADGRPISARVVRINPSAQAGSRSVLAYLGIDDATGLRQGLFALGTLGTQRVSAAALPVSAVRTDKPQPYVQTVENGRIAHRTVQLGVRGMAGGVPMVAVTGVDEKATVTAGAVGPLREGTVVRFTAAGASQGASAGASPASSAGASPGAAMPAAAPASTAKAQ